MLYGNLNTTRRPCDSKAPLTSLADEGVLYHRAR